MSNAANGEPLGWRHAVILYSAQAVRGTAVTPATSCGLATARKRKKTNNQHYRGPGSASIRTRKGGMTGAEVDLRFPAVTSGIKTLLQKATRSGGVLPFVTLGLGYVDDVTPTANKSADQVQDCKVARLRLSLDASNGHGPLTADMTLMGGLVTNLTTLTNAADSSTPDESYEAALLKGGNPFEVRTFEMSVEHNLKEIPVIPGAAPGSNLRGWKYLLEQAEDISGTVSFYAAPGFNVQADSIQALLADLVLTFTNVDDATTLVLTLTSCDFGDEEQSLDENGILWTIPFVAKTWSLA